MPTGALSKESVGCGADIAIVRNTDAAGAVFARVLATLSRVVVYDMFFRC
jgi:hypothetical protein